MYLRTVLKGQGAGEIFQFGWMLQTVESFDQGELEEYVSNFIGLIVGTPEFSALRGIISNDQRYSGVSAYGYTNPNSPALFSADGVIGSAQGVGQSSQYAPLQIAMCVSLHTGHSGASYRGRMYLPATGAAPITGHYWASTDVIAVAQAAADILVDSKNAYASVGSHDSPTVGVWSTTKSLFTPLTEVAVDNVPDTQRRRRDRVTPTQVAHNPIIHSV